MFYPLLASEVPMSLSWSNSGADKGRLSLKVRLFLTVKEFLFEDIPRYAGLLTIWAFAGAVWFFWLGYLCSTTHP